jgi:hypothetical protein
VSAATIGVSKPANVHAHVVDADNLTADADFQVKTKQVWDGTVPVACKNKPFLPMCLEL